MKLNNVIAAAVLAIASTFGIAAAAMRGSLVPAPGGQTAGTGAATGR